MDNPPRELPTVATMPAYHTRQYVFAQAVMLAYEDGVLHPGERDLLDKLADSLEIKPDDVDKAWRRGAEMLNG